MKFKVDVLGLFLNVEKKKMLLFLNLHAVCKGENSV